jgi:DNA-directed RNA polymerase subunit RPC12/RpoP
MTWKCTACGERTRNYDILYDKALTEPVCPNCNSIDVFKEED